MINLVSKYVPVLVEKLAVESRTSVLDTSSDLIRETADAKSFMLADIALGGLGNYDRKNGFTKGGVDLTWHTYTFSNDRGTEFNIDAMDDAETLGVLFANCASEFLRVKVAPEIDAIRFAKLYASNGYDVDDANLTSSTAVPAIDEGLASMEDAEVAMEEVVIFATPRVYKAIKESTVWDRPLTPSENPNRNFGTYDGHEIIKVPQTRFYSAITLYDGKTEGQTDGGYIKNVSTGKNLNFMLVAKNRVICLSKHAVLRTFAPNENQSADAYKIQYRVYHDCWAKDTGDNGDKGIYASCADESD